MMNRFKEAARKRALYLQTRNEIARMPLDIALDLDIYPGDAAQIAHDAVYGRA
jgi:ATP-dependent protease HslVU (ClpYQ) peptidase subunit